MRKLIYRAVPLVFSILLLGAGCVPVIDVPKTNEAPQPASPENENPAQVNARQKCTKLGGQSRLEFSQLSGEIEITCSFKDGECSQNELNGDQCFVQKLTIDQARARTTCLTLGGTPRKEMSALYGEKQIFCMFDGGECTQNELNRNECFKQRI